jgi:NitT/TauT family transport system substrate-binding protein
LTLTRRRFGAVAALAVTATAGCTRAQPHAIGTKVLQHVTYLTGFGVSGRESHAWVAQAKGFFAEAGLEVTIQPGAAGDSNHLLLNSGKAQFAGVDASGAFIRYGLGADRNFQIVAAVQQSTLLSVIALDSGRITAPHDLVGKRIGVAPGSAPKTMFPAYARLAGFDDKTVIWVDGSPQQLPAMLIAGQVDGIAIFALGAAGVEKAAHKNTVVLPYSSYIGDLFGTVLVAPKKLIDGHPDLVRRFTGALLRGLQYALEHPDQAGQILKKAQPTQDAQVAAREMELMRPYALPAHGEVIGIMAPNRIARTIATLQSLSLIPEGLTPEQIVRPDLLGTAPTNG